MSQTTLLLAQRALHSPNGTNRALKLLEDQVARNEEVARDGTIWACIAHLRLKKGDEEGAAEASRRARELVDARGSQPRRLSFGELAVPTRCVKGEDSGENGEGIRERCEQILKEMKVSKEDGGKERVERLVARSKRLREISDALLRGME